VPPDDDNVIAFPGAGEVARHLTAHLKESGQDPRAFVDQLLQMGSRFAPLPTRRQPELLERPADAFSGELVLVTEHGWVAWPSDAAGQPRMQSACIA